MKQSANNQSSYCTYTYLAIRVALILAIVCIAINTWVLWSVYMNEDASDPTLAAVEKLGDDLGSRVSSIDQRLLILEQKILDLSHVTGNSEEVLAALAKLDELETELKLVQEAVQAQPEQVAGILDVISALQQSVLSAIDEMEQKISHRFDQQFVSRIDSILSSSGVTTVTVRKGDTIWELASQYENPPSKALIDRIMEYNMISDPTKLQIGQKIIIPQS